eukprot:103127_1
MKLVFLFTLWMGLSFAMQTSNRPGGSFAVDRSDEAWNRIASYIDVLHEEIYDKLEENDSIELYELCKFPVIEAMQQVVAGMNYWTKVSLCDGSYVFVYFYVPLGADPKPELMAMEFPRRVNDELTMFRKNDIKPKKDFYRNM